jgi:hypothetical protein
MNGLIRKDLMTFIKAYKPTGLIGTVLLLGFLLFQKSDTPLLIVNFILLPMSASAYPSMLSHFDAGWKWERYLLTMPVTIKEIVKSRMVSSYIIFLIQVGILEVFNIAFCMTHTGMSGQNYLFIIVIGFLLSAIMVAILTALDFVSKKNRGGSKSGLIGQLIFILIGASVIIAVNNVSFEISSLLLISKELVELLMCALLIIAVSGAYFISVSSYKKALRTR